MPINPAIAMGVQPLQLPDPLAQYGKIAAIQQAQNQNALAQYQLAAAQRADIAAENRLNALAAAGADESAVANALLRAGDIKGYAEFEKARSERATQALTREKTKGDILKGQSELIDAKLRQSRAFLDTLDPADPNAPAMYMQWHEANHADPVLGPALAARGITADQSRARIQQAIQQGPQAFAQLLNQSKLGTEKFMELNKPTTQVVDQNGQRQVVQLPGLGGAPVTVGTYADVPLPPDVEAQKARIAAAARPRVEVKLPEQEKAFEGALGKKQAEKLIEDKGAAEDARAIISSIQEGRKLLKAGVITGAGAEFLTSFGAVLNQAGINFAEDKVANTQAFAANMASNVGRTIKQFGAGTGLSNADREYAEKMAGGKITLDRKSIERIMDINERAARNAIALHNKNAAGVRTNIPLTVEPPPAEPTTGAAASSIRSQADAILRGGR